MSAPKAKLHPFTDLRNLVYVVWKHLNLPDPTPVQYDICEYLQHGPRRRVAEAFRGVGKSWLTAVYVIQLLWSDPQHRIMVVSASKMRADAFSLFVKKLIEEIPQLQHLRPRPGQRSSNLAFDVGPALPDQTPSVRSVGITGQMTGGRADTIIADDVEVPSNSMTQMQQEKLSEQVKEFDAILKPGGQVVYLGTPQTEQSLYNRLAPRGYSMRVWPARYPKTAEKREAYGALLAPFLAAPYDANPKKHAWKPTDTQRFDEADLQEREASYGRSGFALQFQLDTTLSDAERYPLKLADLIVMDVDRNLAPVRTVWSSSPDLICDISPVGFTGDRLYRPMHVSPEMLEYEGSVMTIDPSGGGKDEVGYAVTKMLRGMIYCRRASGLQGGYSTATLETLANIAKSESVRAIVVEKNFGDGMFAALFKPVLTRLYPCTLENVTHFGQKERRLIDALEPVLNQHRLVMDAAVLRADQKTEKPQYQLFHQMTRLTADRHALAHEDRLEALAMGVTYWMDALERDVTTEEDRRLEELWQEDLESFENNVIGRVVSSSPNFYDTI